MLQPPASLPSTSDSGITNMLATGMLGKRQRTEDLQQSEERISHPQFCPTPGDHKSKLNEFAMTFSFCTPVYSSLCDGLPCRPRFKATVEFDGKTFESPGFFNTLWQAEQAAALAVLDSFSERASTLVKSPICKILLEIKAQKEGSPLPVYNTTFVSSRSVFTSTVKFNGMEFVGKAANNKKQAENNAATVAWSTLKELKGSAVSTLQVPDNKEKAPVCESNDHTLVQVINHLEETRRVGSQVSAHKLPKAKRLGFRGQVKKLTMEVERLQGFITSISHGLCTYRGTPQDPDQSRVQKENNVQNVVVDNHSRWVIQDGGLQTNGWGSRGNFDNRGQHPTGSQANPSTNHSLARPCTNCSRGISQNSDQTRAPQEKNVQNIVVDNVSRRGIPDVGDLPTNGWGDSGDFDNRVQDPTGSQANPNTNHSLARPCTDRSRGRRKSRGRHRGRSGGRFSGRTSWPSPPTNDQLSAFQLPRSSNQSGGGQEINAQNGALNAGSGWDVAGIDEPPTTEWDGWGKPEDIHQPRVGSQTTTWRDHSSAQARARASRSGRCGRSPSSTRHAEWTPLTRNDKQIPRLELAISPVRGKVPEENVEAEKVDDGLERTLPDSGDPPAIGSGGWSNFDDKDPPTTGIVSSCA